MLNNDKTVQYRILYVLSVNHSVQLKEAAHDELMKGSLTVGRHLRARTGEITPGAVHMWACYTWTHYLRKHELRTAERWVTMIRGAKVSQCTAHRSTPLVCGYVLENIWRQQKSVIKLDAIKELFSPAKGLININHFMVEESGGEKEQPVFLLFKLVTVMV